MGNMNLRKTVNILLLISLLTLSGVFLSQLFYYRNKSIIIMSALGLLSELVAIYVYRKEILTIKKELKDSSKTKPNFNALPYYEELDQMIRGLIREENQKNEMEAYDRQATLAALQSQINPHFLYNTLESIRGQALIDDNKEIAVMLEELGSFFRYSISRRENIVTLLEEIQNIKGYMFIQNYRFGGRYNLEIDYQIDEEEANRCLLPKLILQPIVENALIHGFEDRSKGKIDVVIDGDEDNLLITVSDDGSGMNENKLSELNQSIEGISSETGNMKHNGIALENVNKRIHILFGERYGLHAYSTPGQGTDIEIFLPRTTDTENKK